MAGAAKGKNLEETPTFRVAFIVFVFVSVSLVFEKGLHHLAVFLKKRKQKGLYHAIETVKEELMLLGFISLLLTIFQDEISAWCVTKTDSYDWLPCRKEDLEKKKKSGGSGYGGGSAKEGGDDDVAVGSSAASDGGAGRRRLLAAPAGACPDGTEPFMSYDAMHYVHYFIFILAMVMIVYSSLAFVLSFLRIRGWRAWEDKALSDDYLQGAEAASSKEERLKFAGLRERKAAIYAVDEQVLCRAPRFWISSYLFQFVRSLQEEDYLTLRMLFITNHNLMLSFDFHKYLTKCMEEDFASVIGISVPMWVILCVLLIFNVKRNGLFFLIGIAGLVLCTVVGMKLVAILRTVSAESSKGTGVFAASDPKPTDELFWFHKPSLLLFFVHLIFFANSVELSAFIFYSWKFGMDSCLQDETNVTIIRVVLAFLLLVLSSYVTLPLYALVAQMGSCYRPILLPDHVHRALATWAKGAKKPAV